MGNGKIAQCKVGPQEVKEAVEGTECGMRFEGKVKIEIGDILGSLYRKYVKARKIVFNT